MGLQEGETGLDGQMGDVLRADEKVAGVQPMNPWDPRHSHAHSVKSHLAAYWAGRAPGFAQLHKHELFGYRRELWERELLPLLPAAPQGRALRVLDVGCGSGFLALLLAGAGHDVLGVDLVPEMIEEARACADELGLLARFEVMDAEAPQLPDASVDVLVTRNLSWALPDLPAAYRAWSRLLVPGGLLINFDADYVHEESYFDSRVSWRRAERRGEQERGFADGGQGAHGDLSDRTLLAYEHIKEHLLPRQHHRPAWDRELLEAAGFTDVEVDVDAWQRLRGQDDELANPSHVFRITARTSASAQTSTSARTGMTAQVDVTTRQGRNQQ